MTNRSSYLVLFIPWLVVFLIFTAGLAGYNLFISFTDWTSLRPSFRFAGFSNYIELFATTGFLKTTLNMVFLLFVGLPVALVVAVLLAILMDATAPLFAALFRVIAIMSMALGGTVVALFWMWMFRYDNGGINGLLAAVGLEGAMVDWLGNPNVVLTTILIIYIWKFAGYGGLIISGGFQGIPVSQIESASIDGATLPQIYLNILLPQVRGQVFSVAVIFLMYFLKSFDYIWPLTAGGPGWSSTVYPILVYRTMFKSYNFAQGAAAANFLFLVVALIIVPHLVRSRKRDG